MQYAVIKAGSKQYKVSVGDTLSLDRLNFSDKNTHVFDKVLLLVDGGRVSVGKPIIKGASVSAKLIENKKGDKIRVVKYKPKVRYRRVMGFRPQLSLVKIEKIETGLRKTAQKPDKTAKTAPKSSKK